MRRVVSFRQDVSMKRKEPRKEADNSEPLSSSNDVPEFRLDQFAAHQFLQTLRRHAGQWTRADAPATVAAPHFANDES